MSNTSTEVSAALCTAIAALRYCQSQRVKLSEVMPHHFDEGDNITAAHLEAAIEVINGIDLDEEDEPESWVLELFPQWEGGWVTAALEASMGRDNAHYLRSNPDVYNPTVSTGDQDLDEALGSGLERGTLTAHLETAIKVINGMDHQPLSNPQ
jgi:hypothetical protein